jgi:hypothetical protein
VHAPSAGNSEDPVTATRALSDAVEGFASSARETATDKVRALTRVVAAALSRSNATAFCSLSRSPSLTMYVLGVYREKSKEDTRDSASLLCPPR